MASSKRKLDEKHHLKILRELVSLPGNKECFDCRQRGPTYVNVTIGSFVCTTCSGMLRGITPPHRVKSISMATFTPEEIDFIKQHGNDYCRRTWLGLMSTAQQNQNIDKKDEQKMKDLMSAKYEFKRFYLDPSLADDNTNGNDNNNKKSQLSNGRANNINNNNINNKNSNNHNNHNNNINNNTSIPRVPQIGVLLLLNTPDSKMKNLTINNTPDTFSTDFIADFNQVPDPFVPVTRSLSYTQAIEPQPSFANFDNNPAFDSSNNSDLSALFNQTGKAYMSNGINVPPSEDRYAALKDLDSMMKKTQLNDDNTPTTTVSSSPSPWITTTSNPTNTLWGTNDQTAHVISNPFAGNNDLWRPSLHVINNNNVQSFDNTLCNAANPFKQTQSTANNESQWINFGSQNATDALPSSQMMTSLPGKVWHPTVPAYQNPFMVGTGVGNPVKSSNNPFL